jgi:class 3 adenylate cyclase
VDFRLLGPLEVVGDDGREIAVKAGKERALLAVLLLHANELVSSDVLVEELWGESPPATAHKMVQNAVSSLRRALGANGRLETQRGGYRLKLAAGERDVDRFEALVARGRARMAADPEEAAAALRAALELWRGPPLADLTYEAFARTEVARLDERRQVAFEETMEAELARGRHADLIAELEVAVAENPYRERLRAQLMLALYRCDRQAEALEVYRDARSQLVEEMGIEPGERLRELERAILAQDPALAAPAREVGELPPERDTGTPLARREEELDSIRPETRGIVTVLFADISGSTGLGEVLDPEPLRHVQSRYFAEMKLVVERHGGLVEKFIGDAVMAVFGIPLTHEDDAVRAVRAAAEMRTRLAALNEEFASSWGVTVATRIGLNTGEVLMAERSAAQSSLVVGDPVNTAARLEQAAQPGEILIGEDTYRLVHEAVIAERVGPLELGGKAAAVPTWRLLDVIADAPGWGRRLDSPLVGRTRELGLLEDAFQRVADDEICELVTVMGPAGVGKSRLIRELISRLGARATALQGRCLPYGDGITFWPVASIVMDALGMEKRDAEVDVRRRVAELLATTADPAADAELVSDGLTALLGLGVSDVGIQETYWAVRRFLESLAAHKPLVVAFDDIQWGERTFLDLLDYLADRIQGAPVLVLCQARPELLDARPEWMTAKRNASLTTLAPLTERQTEGLIRGLVGGAELPAEATSRIAEVTEGNPLFVEETIRMLVDDGVLRQRDGRWTVTGNLSSIAIPLTIHALLAARLDRLEPEQRAVIERASVIGRSFWWGAVSDLVPKAMRSQVGACLQSLVRKELIRPDRSEIRGQDAFRFTHILVRDSAYSGIPKATRVEMHERLAHWIEVNTRDLAGEYEEIVAYHLEQAHRVLLELGRPSDRTVALGERAAERLAAAGERAFARGDMAAAVNLLTRATALMPSHDARRLELLPEIAFALMETAGFDRLVAVAREMEKAAAETRDAGLQAHALVIGLWIRLFTNPEGWAAEAEGEARRAIATFRRLGDERGLARAWSLLGLVVTLNARFAPAEEAWSKAVEHAQRAADRREALEGLSWVAAAVWLGPTPAQEGIRRCREVFDHAQGDRKAMSTALCSQAGLEACLGHFDEARELFGRGQALIEEVALPVWMAGGLAQPLGWALLLEGKPTVAEQELRRGYETLRAIGEVTFLSTITGILAEAIYAQGKYDEAEGFTRISEESAGADDVYSQVLWRSVRAKCIARRGKRTEALGIACESVRLVESTDALDLRRHTLASQAEVCRLAGRTTEAQTALHEAIRAAEQKENLVGARLAREALHGLLEPLRHPDA